MKKIKNIKKKKKKKKTAPHGSELPYVFGQNAYAPFYSMSWNDTLSTQMQSSWANFGINGNPNIYIPNQIEWKTYDISQSNVFIFDTNPRLETNYISNYNNGACLFWKNVNFWIQELICFNNGTL